MSQDIPAISVIIPTRDASAPCAAAASLAKARYPQDRIEIILVSGQNPSAQRNAAARRATGEYLLFLDDDSEIHPRALQVLRFAFADHPNVAGFGGPAVPKIDHASSVQAAIKNVMQSIYAFGPSRKRYFPIGEPRPATEQSLILCNFAIRKSAWDRHSGFSEQLFPNEENEFFNRIIMTGEKLFYLPSMLVYRRLALTPWTFIKKMYSYGCSRARHIKLYGYSGRLSIFAPILLFLYTTAVLSFFGVELWQGLLGTLANQELKLTSLMLVLPLLSYALLIGTGVTFSMISSRRFSLSFALTVLTLLPLTHVAYAWGMLLSLILPARPMAALEPTVILQKSLDAK